MDFVFFSYGMDPLMLLLFLLNFNELLNFITLIVDCVLTICRIL